MLFTKDRPKLCLELTNLKLFGTSIMKFGGVLMCYYSFATLGFALGLGQFLVALGPKFKKSRCIISSARFLGCLDLEICLYVWRSRWWKTHRWTHRVTTLQFLVSSIKWLVFFCCLLVYRSYRKDNTQFWIVFQNKKLGWFRLIPTSEDLCWFTLLQCK